jgi:hypothetical protein
MGKTGMIIGIDPGSEETAYAVIDENYNVIEADKLNNEIVLQFDLSTYDAVVIESIQSYGMAVGRTVFETCYMIGMLIQRATDDGSEPVLYPRPEYAKAIAGVNKVNDSILRQALLLRFGGDKKGEPMNKLKGNSDKRSAFAVAAYHLDKG